MWRETELCMQLPFMWSLPAPSVQAVLAFPYLTVRKSPFISG